MLLDNLGGARDARDPTPSFGFAATPMTGHDVRHAWCRASQEIPRDRTHGSDDHPRHRSRRRALITHACDWSRARRLPSIALSTFRDVPWNAPLYARLGFVETHTLTPALVQVQAHEATLGFPMARRVIMRRLL